MDATLEVRDLDRSCQAFSKGLPYTCKNPCGKSSELLVSQIDLGRQHAPIGACVAPFSVSSTRGINPVRRYYFMGVILKQVASNEAASREGSTVQ